MSSEVYVHIKSSLHHVSTPIRFDTQCKETPIQATGSASPLREVDTPLQPNKTADASMLLGKRCLQELKCRGLSSCSQYKRRLPSLTAAQQRLCCRTAASSASSKSGKMLYTHAVLCCAGAAAADHCQQTGLNQQHLSVCCSM
jgi:hypothetical protein